MARGDPRDVLVLAARHAGAGYTSLGELPDGSVIGTSSLRRTALLKRLHPRLVVKSVRGNLQLRLAKLDGGSGTEHPQRYDALILAAVGMQRMGYSHRITALLPTAEFPYAVGQGSLGLEIRENDTRVAELLRCLNDESAREECEAERSFLRALAGGCRVPVGVSCVSAPETGHLALQGWVWSTDGAAEFSASGECAAGGAVHLGTRLAVEVQTSAREAGRGDVLDAVAIIG